MAHPSSLSMRGDTTQPALRVRPQVARGGIVRKAIPPRPLKNECYSAVFPVLVIAAVWCFGCYICLWISLYRSFAADVDGQKGNYVDNERKDILAIKLGQFLTGDNPKSGAGGISKTGAAEIHTADSGAFQGGGVSHSHPLNDTTHNHNHKINSTFWGQLTDPAIQKRVKSVLISRTGYPNLILGAYLEPPLLMEEVHRDSFQRMKLRTHSPKTLKYSSYPYHNLQSNDSSITGNQAENAKPGACSHKGAQWIFPTSHPKSLDHYFEGTVFKKHNSFDKRWELALGIRTITDNTDIVGYCPVDADPFLPWIHDAFPSNDGKHIEFIISNKRRCNTDPKTFLSDLKNLEPQVALMQPVPVKRMKMEEVDKFGGVLNKLWQADSDSKYGDGQSEPFIMDDNTFKPPRYILGTSLGDADVDGKYTRFICRFHTVVPEEAAENEPRLKKKILGETLSTYPYNPEHANYRKRGSKPMLTSLEKGKDEQVWNAVYFAMCPVPDLEYDANSRDITLSGVIASGKSVFRGTPSIYLDIIPIRTPTRRNREGFGLPGISTSPSGEQPLFDPRLAWGETQVLPQVEASGRWANIPICRPPKMDEGLMDTDASAASEIEVIYDSMRISSGSSQRKAHFLVACVWASLSFSTRGQVIDTDSSTSARLREFLTYHTQIAGFDHIYVYDNSDVNGGNLMAVTKMFPSHIVTRVPWPHRVCNNNRPMHANPGERSSQYAAENSCRARYGPDTTWMATLDVDEYLIPTGKQWKNVRHWLEYVTSNENSTKILSFFQTRSLPNVDLMIPYEGSYTASCKGDRNVGILNATCLMKDPAKTFMETYNCEPTTHPKPQGWAWRAKKQIYRPDFVLNHFVHYSVVTKQIIEKPLETSPRFAERAPFERRVNELTEGFLLHTKTTGPDMTFKWHENCLRNVYGPRKGTGAIKNNSCKVGIASKKLLGEEPNLLAGRDGTESSSIFKSNCYPHGRIMSEWVPKLESALKISSYGATY